MGAPRSHVVIPCAKPVVVINKADKAALNRLNVSAVFVFANKM
jgi:hypothetical protein